MSIIPLRKFIWSFTRLRDLESAHKTLQQMVSLVGRGNFSIGKTVYGKLYSTRMDIPVPSNKGLGLTLSDLKELKKLDSCTSAELYALNGEERSLHVKVLRWSFNDIIHGCANQKNYILAKKLMLQVYISLSMYMFRNAPCNTDHKLKYFSPILCNWKRL